MYTDGPNGDHVIFIEYIQGNNVYYTHANLIEQYDAIGWDANDGMMYCKPITSFTSTIGAYSGFGYFQGYIYV